jgi:large subunit ribosomal protein L13
MSNLLPLQRTTFIRNEDIKKEWLLIDAQDQTLGRFASQVASLLRGKHKPVYSTHQDIGDFVIVINADKIQVTGKKMDQKVYYAHSGYPGGLKTATLKEKMVKDPQFAVTAAVKRMLPKGVLGRKMLSNLKVYAGTEHGHQAQKPVEYKIRYTK